MKECIRCHHSNDDKNDYCIKCGAPLYNYCTNRHCIACDEKTILPDEAAFCPKCGYETLFKTYGITSSSLDISDEDLPF